VVVDGGGQAYVAGNVSSADFPVTAGAHDTTVNGVFDAFVAKLDAAGSALVYSTFLGGTTVDLGDGIGIDATGSAYVGGRTDSVNFPTTVGAWDQMFNGVRDAYVTKLNPAGSGLVYSTYVGGADDDIGNDVAVDASGTAFVTGQTASLDFPTTSGAHNTTYNLGYDAFVTRLDTSGSALLYSTYLGGTAEDGGSDVAVDDSRNAYVTGLTLSPDYPTTPGAYDTTFNGSSDAIVAQLDTTAPGEGDSTPGRVTGGGSILADGSLAPATLSIESGINASIGDTATFGFAVQFEAGDPNPTGNLTYNDHGADVRIKALSFSLLSIGVGPCGMDTHAKFRGTAEVTGPGMPSMQDFEVDVDDCGEPGSAPGVGPDTFMIRTSVGTTIHYLAAGPLVGGNIQVQRD
jgi:hypothetical protein